MPLCESNVCVFDPERRVLCALCRYVHAQTREGIDFCQWVRRAPTIPSCFICGRIVPNERRMATTICVSCERHGPPRNKDTNF